MTKIAILGAGNMGTGLSTVFKDKDYEVVLWSIDEKIVKNINEKRENKKYLPNVKLSRNVKCVNELKTALKNAVIVVFAVPSHAVREVCIKSRDLISRNAVIVNLAKGLEEGSNKRMSEVIKEYFINPVISAGGPGIADESAHNIPTFAVYASDDKKALQMIKELFGNDYYRISTSNDLNGVELCGFLKNIISILCGVSDGLGYGANTKSGLISNGLEELKIVCRAMGGREETIFSLAGLGDLIVTCFSQQSRNRRFGEYLGKGLKVDNALKKVGQVVEGVKGAKIAHEIIKDKNLNCPLIEKVYNIIFLGEKPDV